MTKKNEHKKICIWIIQKKKNIYKIKVRFEGKRMNQWNSYFLICFANLTKSGTTNNNSTKQNQKKNQNLIKYLSELIV